MQSSFVPTTIVCLVSIEVSVFTSVVRSLSFSHLLPPVFAHGVEVFSTRIMNHFGGVVCLISLFHISDDY